MIQDSILLFMLMIIAFYVYKRVRMKWRDKIQVGVFQYLGISILGLMTHNARWDELLFMLMIIAFYACKWVRMKWRDKTQVGVFQYLGISILGLMTYNTRWDEYTTMDTLHFNVYIMQWWISYAIVGAIWACVGGLRFNTKADGCAALQPCVARDAFVARRVKARQIRKRRICAVRMWRTSLKEKAPHRGRLYTPGKGGTTGASHDAESSDGPIMVESLPVLRQQTQFEYLPGLLFGVFVCCAWALFSRQRSRAPQPALMQIFVKTSPSSDSVTLEVERSDTIDAIRERYFAKTGSAKVNNRFLYAGKQLEGHRTLADYNIGPCATLHVSYRLRGGGGDERTTTRDLFRYCHAQLDSNNKPCNKAFKQHLALLKCDSKLVERMEAAGKSEQAVKILLGAARRYGLPWAGARVASAPAPVPKTRHSGNDGETFQVQRKEKRRVDRQQRREQRTDKQAAAEPAGHASSGKGVGKKGSASKDTEKTGKKGGWDKIPRKVPTATFALDKKEWSAEPVSVLTPGAPGVCFCSHQNDAKEQAARVQETSTPAAIVTSTKVHDWTDAIAICFNMIVEDGGVSTTRLMSGYLYNVGKGTVRHTESVTTVQLEDMPNDTITLLVELHKDFTDEAAWAQLQQGKIGVIKRLLAEACNLHKEGLNETDVVGVFKLAKTDSLVSAVIRIKGSAKTRCMTTSGYNGVFFRPLGTLAEEFKVVWLKGEQALNYNAAVELAANMKSQGALGLAVRPNSLGLRCENANFEALRQALGRAPSQPRWAVVGFPWSTSDAGVQDVLKRYCKWDVSPLHPQRTRGAPSATWIVAADQEPQTTGWRIMQPDGLTYLLSASKMQNKKPQLKQWATGKSRQDAQLEDKGPRAEPTAASTRTWADIARKSKAEGTGKGKGETATKAPTPQLSHTAAAGREMTQQDVRPTTKGSQRQGRDSTNAIPQTLPAATAPTATNAFDNRIDQLERSHSKLEKMLTDIHKWALGAGKGGKSRPTVPATSSEENHESCHKKLKREPYPPPQKIKMCQLDNVDAQTIKQCGGLERVRGDGNCLFTALGKLLAERDRDYTWREMRNALQIYSSNPQWKEEAAGTLDMSWDKWRQDLNGDGSSRDSWGDETAAIILVASLAQKRRLYIYNAKDSVMIHFSWPGQEMEVDPVVLWFNGTHYDPFWLDTASCLPAITEDITDWRAKWKGGGR